MDSQTRKYLYGHTSPETAYLVDDYPWGFRLRTQIRYWVESKDAKNGGQRFVSQTINPKTGQWCAPKRSTYSPIVVMYLDDKDYVQWSCLLHHSSDTTIQQFKDTHLDCLDEFQKRSLKEIIAFEKVMRNVTFTCSPVRSEPVSLTSQAPKDIAARAQLLRESEEREQRRSESFKNINRAIHFEISQVTL